MVSGCTWGRREAAVNSVDLATTPENQVLPSVTVDSQGGTGEASSIKLTNIRELPVSSDGMVAAGYDGLVRWSPDGAYIAIHMSNLTAGSTQVQIVNAGTGQRVAVVNGYNLYWDTADPTAIIFTQHQYYGEPDYGSHEVTLKVKQSDLFKAGVFDEAKVSASVIGDSAGQTEVLDEPPSGSNETELTRQTPGGEFTFFTREAGETQPLYALKTGEPAERAVMLTGADVVVDAFDLTADGRRIVYKQVQGEKDEFGNRVVMGDQVKFYIADISY